MKHATVNLQPFFKVADHLQGFQIVSASIGFDGNLYVLLIDQSPERIDGMFVQSATKDVHTYKVLTVGSDVVDERIFHNQKYNYHFVQPVHHDKLLLVGARSRYYDKNHVDRNARLFDWNGELQKELLLGDGIQHLQVTESGTIWTGYFDEGVFGNYGWDKPIGAPGLIAWNLEGEQIFCNTVADICDCYALNVISDQDVWFYYYYDFKLCNLRDSRVYFYEPGISGSAGFIKHDRYFLFDKGYNHHDQYALLRLGSFKFKELCSVQFVNERGEKIRPVARDFRGNKLLLMG